MWVRRISPIAVSFVILVSCSHSDSSAQQRSIVDDSQPKEVSRILLPRSGSTQSELDHFAFQLLDGHDVKYDYKMSGEVMMAIVRANAAFDELGLAISENEYEKRLIAVGKINIEEREFFIVDFQPRYVPIETLPGNIYDESDQPYAFYPIEIFRFFISTDNLKAERYEVISQ